MSLLVQPLSEVLTDILQKESISEKFTVGYEKKVKEREKKTEEDMLQVIKKKMDQVPWNLSVFETNYGENSKLKP